MNTDKFKLKLEEELATVEAELVELGHEDIDKTATETDEIADRFEAEEEHEGETKPLLARRAEIRQAMERIANGTFGICEECGAPIEPARLEANPAAKTCEAHM
jgi:DnaK suppressor protein